MKISVAVIIALACVLGLALADYGSAGYMPYYGSSQGSGGFGDGGFLMLIGFLFLIFILFGFGNQQDTISFVNVSR